jgi:pimeloyl-ACP methyl ester carboxylesterase
MGLSCPSGQLDYFEMGDVGDPVIVVLPGWMMTGPKFYSGLARSLVELKGYRVIMPVQPGHGGTSNLPKDRMTLEGLIDWNLHFLDELRDVRGPVEVIGNSVTGSIAAGMQLIEPGIVSGATLLNPIGGTAWKGGRSMVDRSRASWVVAFMRESMQRRGLEITWKFWAEALPNAVGNTKGMFDWSELGRTADATTLTAVVSRWPRGSKVGAAIDAVTMLPRMEGVLVAGASDRVVTAESVESLRQVLGLEAVTSVAKATHATGLVAPELWLDVVPIARRSTLLPMASGWEL